MLTGITIFGRYECAWLAFFLLGSKAAQLAVEELGYTPRQ